MQKFAELLERKELQPAVKLLSAEKLQLSDAQTVALLDAACEASIQTQPPSSAALNLAWDVQAALLSAEQAQREQQQQLTNAYEALRGCGALRGFGSVTCALLPAADVREVSTEKQLLLTGLPTSAFAPPRGNRPADIVAGGVSALGATALASQFDLDLRVVIGATGAALLADRLALGGALLEGFTRLVKPGYATTVREHEAGHFLCAYLLGCPIEACVLNTFAAAADRRLSGAAGTVFFDPELGEAMRTGTLTRDILDRYSVVVMAGIAAEACNRGKAEGGQSDENALIQLLAGLDGGKSWDLPRIRNQARWAASQAALLLREHGTAYTYLCEALAAGASVGGCVRAIERGLEEQFGRNGELPAETRARALERLSAAAAQERATSSQVGGGGGGGGGATLTDKMDAPAPPAMDADAMDRRQEEIAARLEEIKRRLQREEETWS